MTATTTPTATGRKTTPLVLAMLTLAAICGGLGWQMGRRAASGIAGDPAPAMAPAAATAGNDAELADGAHAAATSVRMTPTVAIGNGQPRGALALLAAPNLEKLKQDQAQKKRQLESNFDRDPQDPNADQVELAMLKTMVDPMLINDGIAPGNPEVECHRGSCRISADFSNADDASGWAVNYLTMLGGKLGTSQPVFNQKPDGTVRMQLYGVRR
jgi:hypothetical protein